MKLIAGLKGRFPAVTPLRLVLVATGLSVATPFAWVLWFQKIKMPLLLQKIHCPLLLWQCLPLTAVLFLFATLTYWMWQEGYMKAPPPEEPIQFEDSSELAQLSHEEFWAAVAAGKVKVKRVP